MPRIPPEPSRRAVLAGGAAVLAAPLLKCSGGGPALVGPAPGGRLSERRIGGQAIALTAEERPALLGASTGSTPAWLYEDALFPVFRVKHGESVDVTLRNQLKEHTSIHWHGVRGPNAMDGVPYVTQMPVEPGETFSYRFTPPDAGTFFFHPHCNTAEQLGRGLSGVLIVEDAGPSPFADDIALVLKDWRLAEDGHFLPFVTVEGAGRAGTFGTLRTVNGTVAPRIAVPAGAKIRLRIVNVDSTRIGDIGVMGADAVVLAIDGNRTAPFALDTWRLGPAMRLDLALETPKAGGGVALIDYFAPEPVTLATLVAETDAKRAGAAEPGAIAAATLPEPDVAKAERHELRLSASATPTDYAELHLAPIQLPNGQKIDLLDSLCSTSRTMWAIDGKPWPQTGHQRLPPPLMTLSRGTTAVLELVNTTRQVHPMHVHGHSFKVLSTTKLKRPVHWADTVLVMPDERVEIAFVADNPGNWMLHCHIIEHQDTGMMAWFRVV